MMAVPLSTLMSAPMRVISAQCMKRWGKMVSSTTDMPGVMAKSEVNWACMSVGKPGNGAVTILAPIGSLPGFTVQLVPASLNST